MDSLTHIAIGACIGEAFFEKGFGKKAMIWGALAQSIPDIDFLAALWLSPSEALLAHRGFTHSFLFGMLCVFIFSMLAQKIHQPENISFRKWMLFFFAAIFVHLFIDAFNNYGVGWFEPFSTQRISFNTLYVVDPFFSLAVWVAAFRLFFLNRFALVRCFWWKTGLVVPLLYLFLSVVFKLNNDMAIESELKKRNINDKRYFSTPAPLQIFLWYNVVERKNDFLISYRSVFDTRSKITFYEHPKSSHWISSIDNHESLQRLIRFSQGYYTLEKKQDVLMINDLRFGQIGGWEKPDAPFVFHFLLSHPADDRLIIQKGRMAMFNQNDMFSLLKRIYGN